MNRKSNTTKHELDIARSNKLEKAANSSLSQTFLYEFLVNLRLKRFYNDTTVSVSTKNWLAVNTFYNWKPSVLWGAENFVGEDFDSFSGSDAISQQVFTKLLSNPNLTTKFLAALTVHALYPWQDAKMFCDFFNALPQESWTDEKVNHMVFMVKVLGPDKELGSLYTEKDLVENTVCEIARKHYGLIGLPNSWVKQLIVGD